MAITIILVVIAFVWLGYETNWMRVRLFVGHYYNRLFKRMDSDIRFLIFKSYVIK